jgi:hypothetical protein
MRPLVLPRMPAMGDTKFPSVYTGTNHHCRSISTMSYPHTFKKGVLQTWTFDQVKSSVRETSYSRKSVRVYSMTCQLKSNGSFQYFWIRPDVFCKSFPERLQGKCSNRQRASTRLCVFLPMRLEAPARSLRRGPARGLSHTPQMSSTSLESTTILTTSISCGIH